MIKSKKHVLIVLIIPILVLTLLACEKNQKVQEDLLQQVQDTVEAQSAVTYYNRGTKKLNLKEYEEAIRAFDTVIELKPQYADAYNYRGFAKAQLEKFDAAIRDFDKAIELNPQYAEAYTKRGLLKVSLGKYDEAIEDADKAIELNPQYADAYYMRGFVKFFSKKYAEDEVRRDYDKARELDPHKFAEAAYYTELQ